MNRLPLEGAVALAAVLFLAACTSALKEPPPVADIGEVPVLLPTEQADAAALLLDAETELKKMPDAGAVQRAQQLFLEAARLDNDQVESFLGAARATAWLIEHEEHGQRRKELAVEGVQIGQWCQRLHPEVAECTYRLALAVGQQAREKSSTAVDGLDVMVELLEEVIDEAPHLDHAGGHRVLALVLLRAPGWPTGPGDPEMGLEHARTAVAAFPDHPPNQLVFGEALLDNGERGLARRALERGIELATADADDPEAAEWAAQGEEALAELH